MERKAWFISSHLLTFGPVVNVLVPCSIGTRNAYMCPQREAPPAQAQPVVLPPSSPSSPSTSTPTPPPPPAQPLPLAMTSVLPSATAIAAATAAAAGAAPNAQLPADTPSPPLITPPMLTLTAAPAPAIPLPVPPAPPPPAGAGAPATATAVPPFPLSSTPSASSAISTLSPRSSFASGAVRQVREGASGGSGGRGGRGGAAWGLVDASGAPLSTTAAAEAVGWSLPLTSAFSDAAGGWDDGDAGDRAWDAGWAPQYQRSLHLAPDHQQPPQHAAQAAKSEGSASDNSAAGAPGTAGMQPSRAPSVSGAAAASGLGASPGVPSEGGPAVGVTPPTLSGAITSSGGVPVVTMTAATSPLTHSTGASPPGAATVPARAVGGYLPQAGPTATVVGSTDALREPPDGVRELPGVGGEGDGDCGDMDNPISVDERTAEAWQQGQLRVVGAPDAETQDELARALPEQDEGGGWDSTTWGSRRVVGESGNVPGFW